MKLKLFLCLCILLILTGCSNGAGSEKKDSEDTVEQKNKEEYSTIKFFNSSSYSVSIHRDAFSGPVIVELLPGELKSVEVPVNNNYGIGSTFSIGYKTKVFNEIETACGDVYAYGIDPNMQMTLNLEPNKEKLVTIGQPSNIKFETAFLRIINSSDNYFELKKNGICYKQTGNGNLSVEAGKTGVYEIASSSKGVNFENYKLSTVFTSVDFPSFSAKYNHSYTYVFDGNKITKSSESELSY